MARLTRKRRRLYMVLTGMFLLAVATALMLNAFQDNLVFFHSPTEITEKSFPADRRFRLGGLVEDDSVRKGSDGLMTHFRVTDNANTVEVTFKGMLPDLFREGQGVVAEGKLDSAGVFQASEVLAKHDENYMPPEVAEALKRTGQWKGDDEKSE
jgi:cytochrome c-type biogenesis protein CcmE